MLKFLKTLFRAGRFVYELVQEIRHEEKAEAKAVAEGRRIQSARYQEASNTAGPPATKPKVLH
jgi:hypothetical protein